MNVNHVGLSSCPHILINRNFGSILFASRGDREDPFDVREELWRRIEIFCKWNKEHTPNIRTLEALSSTSCKKIKMERLLKAAFLVFFLYQSH